MHCVADRQLTSTPSLASRPPLSGAGNCSSFQLLPFQESENELVAAVGSSPPPTARQFPADTQQTPPRSGSLPAAAGKAARHLPVAPVQVSASGVIFPLSRRRPPTATQVFDRVQDTPYSQAPLLPEGVASVVSDHFRPFQNSATAVLAGLPSGVVELPVLPTATQLAA